jgi:hypothetical protein
MPPSAFFYYNQDSQQEHCPPGHFAPHQYQQQYQYQRQIAMPMGMVKQQQQQIPPQYIYRPPPQHQNMTQAMYTPRLITPVTSPYGVPQRQSYFVEQHSSPAMFPMDGEYGPSTPPLSASGSAASSPPSNFSMLPTPVNGQYLEALDVKYETFPDMYGGRAWSGQSPPLSPGKC